MLINRYDTNQSGILFKEGRALDDGGIRKLISCSEQIQRPIRNFIDAGAHFGTYSFGILPSISGRVYAFEAQPQIFYMLCGSIALNNFNKVKAFNYALGNDNSTIAIPQFDYNAELNFGSIEFGNKQLEQLGQQRKENDENEYVELRTLDSFNIKDVDMIKIDVEGMEEGLLEGAKETITKYKPILYMEIAKSNINRLVDICRSFGYQNFQKSEWDMLTYND